MDDATRDKLEVLTTRRQLHAARRDDEAATVEKLTGEIKDLLADAGVQALDLDRWKVTLSVQDGRKTLRPDLLLAAGVDVDIINGATVTGTPTTVLRVTEKKAPGA